MRKSSRNSHIVALLGAFVNAFVCYSGHTMDQFEAQDKPAITLLTMDLVQELSCYLTNKRLYILSRIIPDFNQSVVHIDLARYELRDNVQLLGNIEFQSIMTQFPKLRSLDLTHRNVAIKKDNFSPLMPLTNLTSLILETCSITNNNLINLATLINLTLTNLTKLNLGGNLIGNEGLFHLKGLTKLNQLNLRQNYDIRDEGLNHLNELTNLTDLNLSNIKITCRAVEHLTTLINLQSLNLDNCIAVNNIGISALTRFSSLTTLNLFCTTKGHEEFLHLKSFPALTSLSLYSGNTGCKLTDKTLDHLTILNQLSNLNLYGNNYGLTNEGLKHLTLLTNLQALAISYSPNITLEGLSNLKKLPKIRYLYFDNKDIPHAEDFANL